MRNNSSKGQESNSARQEKDLDLNWGQSIEWVSPAQLKPARRNARTHSKKQIDQITLSLEEFGFTNPILVTSDFQIIAGHGRLAAAKKLGLSEVPIIRLEPLTNEQARAYAIADNKLAENAGWDRETLAIELGELVSLDLDFEITTTGFEMGEIDVLIREIDHADPPPEPPLPSIDRNVPAATKLGDLWQVGPHTILCGDALDEECYLKLLDTQKANLVFIDPPYNVKIKGHVSGLGSASHEEFLQASGEMTEPEFEEFLAQGIDRLVKFSEDGSIHFICMDWGHISLLLNVGRERYTELKNLCVWTKTNAGMGSLYRSQHELISVFKNGKSPHTNNVMLGKHGRNRSNVWSYAGMNAFHEGRDEALAMHPTVKPTALVEDAILDCSNRGDIVLDAFLGAGTTALACERTGRVARGIEIDPYFVDVALRRLRLELGVEPVLAETGETFSAREQSQNTRNPSAPDQVCEGGSDE